MIPVRAFHPAGSLARLLATVVLFAGCVPVADSATLGGVALTPAPSSVAATLAEPAASSSPSRTIAASPVAVPTIAPSPKTSLTESPAAVAATAPAVTASPTGTPHPKAAAPAAKPFAMDLYRTGDFVAQYTFEWCVGASLQMALNLTTDEERTSRPDQQRLWEMARDRSSSPFGGANPRGWTAVLNELGIGAYELVSIQTLDDALTVAAEAIRSTKRPVGLVMWRGRHAWVMSGFEATADPRHADDFDVTGIRVLDPLYPHGSSTWGPSPKPNSLVSPATLARQFVVRDVERSRVDLGVPTGYLMIVPVAGRTS